jgi:hypothetical protein
MIGKHYTGMSTFWFWIATWCAVTPALLIALIVFALVRFQPLRIDDYIFPRWVSCAFKVLKNFNVTTNLSLLL